MSKLSLPFLATKTSAYLGLAVSFLGTALSYFSTYSPIVLPLLSPKAASTIGHVAAVVGTVQATISGSIIPRVNAIAAFTPGFVTVPAPVPPSPPAAA